MPFPGCLADRKATHSANRGTLPTPPRQVPAVGRFWALAEDGDHGRGVVEDAPELEASPSAGRGSSEGYVAYVPYAVG